MSREPLRTESERRDLGRWTIRWQPFTVHSDRGGYKLGGREPWPTEEPTPVVPCDDAAVERAAAALAEYSGAWWTEIPDQGRERLRKAARAALRAAGETP